MVVTYSFSYLAYFLITFFQPVTCSSSLTSGNINHSLQKKCKPSMFHCLLFVSVIILLINSIIYNHLYLIPQSWSDDSTHSVLTHAFSNIGLFCMKPYINSYPINHFHMYALLHFSQSRHYHLPQNPPIPTWQTCREQMEKANLKVKDFKCTEKNTLTSEKCIKCYQIVTAHGREERPLACVCVGTSVLIFMLVLAWIINRYVYLHVVCRCFPYVLLHINPCYLCIHCNRCQYFGFCS